MFDYGRALAERGMAIENKTFNLLMMFLIMSKRVIITLFINLFILNVFAQCWENSVPLDIYPDSIVNLPLLEIIHPGFISIIDKSVEFTKNFKFDKDSIWVCFQIEVNYSNSVSIKLRQGAGSFGFWNLCDEYTGCKYYGAFCYKGYTYFVHYNVERLQECEEIFKIIDANHSFNYFSQKIRLKSDAQANGSISTTSYGLIYWYENGEFVFREEWINE